MEPKFVGRRAELALLDRLWSEQKAHFLVLYGRRRVGKTQLLTRWIRSTGHRVLYWMADPDSAEAHLRQFSRAIYSFANPKLPAPENFSYDTWDQAWEQIAALAETERLGVFIDEFTYVMEADPSITGRLQRIWDHRLEQTNIFLAISGSHLGMMQRGFLAYQAPLWGRSSFQLHLNPLPFGETHTYFPGYSAEDRVQIYTIFGGIPYYWRLIDPSKTIAENIGSLLLSTAAPIEGEARLLLQDFLSDIHNYVAILRAIAHSQNTPKDIEKFSGILNVHVSQYLKILNETGYVTRSQPVTARKATRMGRYYIQDPFLRFYFRFLASRRTQVALGETSQAWREIERHLPDFIGQFTWEEICREWVLRAANRERLPVYPDQVESAWTKDAQVDVVGVNSMERQLVLGECKWTSEPEKADVLEKLVSRTELMIPDDRPWTVYYLGFSKNGWTKPAVEFARTIQSRLPASSTWRCMGMSLLDLKQVDEDLIAWLGPVA